MAKSEEVPQTDPAEIEALIERLRQSNLEPQVIDKIERILRFVLVLVNLLQHKNASIKRLRKMIFGPRSEKRQAESPKLAEEKEESGAGETSGGSQPEARAESQEIESSASEPKARRKGHGRRAASAYSGAQKVVCRNEGLKPGDPCSDPLCRGHLYRLSEPNLFIQFTGQPIINATVYEQEVLKCSACQERHVASLPEEVGRERYEATADVAIVMSKYGAGMPWHRLARLQESCGVPMSEAVMCERSQEVAKAVEPVVKELEQLAADGEILYSDDTRVTILECLKENKKLKKQERRGTQTTGIVVKVGERQIALYRSGRKHCGENMDELLEKRSEGLEIPIQMGDALQSNWSKKKKTEEAKCWAHARRKFIEIEEEFPEECKEVVDAIGKVYEIEEQTAGMNAEERLKHHQEHSSSVITELYEWIEEKFREREVEPNSTLGQAMGYLQRHRKELTKFLSLPGIPLDNNPAERVLKRPVLLRKSVMFFKNQRGAELGDRLMSLIETSRLNRINAWEYLLTLVRRADEVKQSPKKFLPWNYPRADSGDGARAA